MNSHAETSRTRCRARLDVGLDDPDTSAYDHKHLRQSAFRIRVRRGGLYLPFGVTCWPNLLPAGRAARRSSNGPPVVDAYPAALLLPCRAGCPAVFGDG